MKINITRHASLLSVLISAFLISGCVKDHCNRTYSYTYFQPVYKTTAEVRANIKSNAPRDIQMPGKIVILGNYIFLNEVDKGIHIIDNTNPAQPVNVSFIDIPGNADLAVKGNTLYADLYTDLVTLDISNPLDIKRVHYNEGVFPNRFYHYGFNPDSAQVIVNWIQRDTTVTESCDGGFVRWVDSQGLFFSASESLSNGANKASISPVGIGGSMARFTIVDNTMYTVSYSDLNVFNITMAHQPIYTKKVNINSWNIETIFPFKNKLFIGSQSGMFVYNINNPDQPVAEGEFGHVQSCDPVIADDDYAYVTLRSGTACQGFTNQLDILRLNNFTDPSLVKSYNLTNPHGLSKDGNYLFICDGNDGLKMYDADNVNALKLLNHVQGIETFDVIAYNKIAFVVASDGLYQYDYSNPSNIRLLSKITLLK